MPRFRIVVAALAVAGATVLPVAAAAVPASAAAPTARLLDALGRQPQAPRLVRDDGGHQGAWRAGRTPRVL